jgi:predicted dehydrogenase
MLRWEDFPDGPPANYDVEFLRAEFRKRLYREENAMNFRGFPSIEGFHVVVKTGQYFNTTILSYRGKIKLHGTNAGIRVSNGEIAAQNRTKIITTQDDRVWDKEKWPDYEGNWVSDFSGTYPEKEAYAKWATNFDEDPEKVASILWMRDWLKNFRLA